MDPQKIAHAGAAAEGPLSERFVERKDAVFSDAGPADHHAPPSAHRFEVEAKSAEAKACANEEPATDHQGAVELHGGGVPFGVAVHGDAAEGAFDTKEQMGEDKELGARCDVDAWSAFQVVGVPHVGPVVVHGASSDGDVVESKAERADVQAEGPWAALARVPFAEASACRVSDDSALEVAGEACFSPGGASGADAVRSGAGGRTSQARTWRRVRIEAGRAGSRRGGRRCIRSRI